MGKKTDTEIFFENVPFFNVWYKALLSSFYHFIIFVIIMISLWWISSKFWILALLAQFMVSSVSNVPFIYMFRNSDKIREKYLKKYEKVPWQHFWCHYSFTSSFGAAALYFPLILKTDYFLPAIISMPSHFVTNSLFPYYIALQLGIAIILFGILFVKPSKDFDGDMGNYLHIMDPNKSRILRGGIYNYIRHPRFLSRFILAVGLGILANNILAILVALIHFVPYFAFMKVLDKESIRIFGDDIKIYQKEVPAFFPRRGNWKKFTKSILDSWH